VVRADTGGSERAIASRHTAMCSAVYATSFGVSVVPEEVWIRSTAVWSTANSPSGYWSRKSFLLVVGNRRTSAGSVISPGVPPVASSSARENGTFSWAVRIGLAKPLDLEGLEPVA
jgi:hypothetical protein